MICPSCGRDQPDANRLCVRCGASLVGDAEDEGAETGAGQASRALLVVVLALTGILAAGIVALFLLPPPHLKVPDIQPVVRVANVRDFPTGTSRMVTWGDRSILVVRRDTHAYFAIDGVGSGDGCFLEWNAEALRVESPCTYVVYDLDGNVVTGLTRTPLKRYRVFERHDVVYVTES